MIDYDKISEYIATMISKSGGCAQRRKTLCYRGTKRNGKESSRAYSEIH